MERNNNITINILPTSPEAWFCISCAIAVLGVASCGKTMKTNEMIEAEIEIAKINAGVAEKK